MFDWNDEELTNILWGEARESDDHIVPYPGESEEKPLSLPRDDVKKEWSQESADVKHSEQKIPVAKTDAYEEKLESSYYNTDEGRSATGVGKGSWTDLSLSNTAKSDKDFMGTEASNSLTETSQYASSGQDGIPQLGNGTELFQNQLEDNDEGEFVDYGWVNIGSFDDLDRIFSNEEPIFGDVSLGRGDELWSSSKDATSSPEKSIPLSMDCPGLGLGVITNASEHFGMKTECVLDEDNPFTTGYDKVNDLSSHATRSVEASMNQMDYSGSKSKTLAKDKMAMAMAMSMVGNATAFNSRIISEPVTTPNNSVDKASRQRNLLKVQKKSEEKREAREFHGTWSSYGNQFQQFGGQYVLQRGQPPASPVLSQQTQFQGHQASLYKNVQSPQPAPAYGSMGNQCPAVPVLPQYHSVEGAAIKPLMMTPQEKIEKLRRRQQMRAMLAIQKQQQQFVQQVSEPHIAQKSSLEKQIPLKERANIEEHLSTFHSIDPNSPVEQDDSNTVSFAIDDLSMGDTVIYQLQDVIAKMDIRIRLCIRDSLFRLAQSAMQRQFASDTSSTNKSSRDEFEALTKEEINSHSRFASSVPDVETDTNPIDRTVAYLLFNRHPNFLEKATGLTITPMAFAAESSKNNQHLPHQIPYMFAEADQSKTSSCVDTSENASNNEETDGGAMEVETIR